MTKGQSIKYIILVLFLVITIVSVALMGGVKTNYNISDYLDEETETKISLKIIEDEFGMTGNIQVMVEDVSVEQALEIGNIIKDIDNVLLVNFDQADPAYYNDGDALFAVIVKGDEYSDTANKVLDDIQEKLDKTFKDKTNYGGSVVEKRNMRESLKTEIVLILVIAIAFAFVIMLFMAKSWIEPIILLAASGVAVFINLGTNIFFDEISYITKAVAAILQLALSVDYGIILLHEYRNQKESIENNEKAMLKAVKHSFKPIVASAFTTMAGLVALFFMTMKIGQDIGAVLTKGIAISAITSIVFLPALLLCLDKLMLKTAKKDLKLSGKGLCKLAYKARIPIVALALVVVTLCGVLQFGNSYGFTDTANPNEKINAQFGASNTIVVVYPNDSAGWQRDEAELQKRLEAFETLDGKRPFQNITAYSTTVLESYDIEKAAQKLNISKKNIELLYAAYHAYNNDAANREISSIDFVRFAIEALAPEEGAEEPEVMRTLQILAGIYDIVNSYSTADEMHALVSSGIMANAGLTKFQIDQMYGLYFWNEFKNDDVEFETMLDYMVELASDPDGKTLMTEKTATDLKELSDGLEEFKEKMNATLDKEGFIAFGKNEFGNHAWVAPACEFIFTLASGGSNTITTIELLSFVNDIPSWLGVPESYKEMIRNYLYVYDAIAEPCSYDNFIPVLKKVILALSNEERVIEPTEYDIQQGYIMYYRERVGRIPNKTIKGIEFINFVNETIATNPTVAGKVTEESKLKLLDVEIVNEFISDEETYGYVDMAARLNQLRGEVKSLTTPTESAPEEEVTDPTDPVVVTEEGSGPVAITEEEVLTLYSLYVESHKDSESDPIVAKVLLDFVKENKDGILKDYMNPEFEAKIAERDDAIARAEALFLADGYNRLLISVDLPSEGEESTRFVEYVLKSVKEVYQGKAHIAGHMVSTVDLQNTFEKDNQIITLVTIIAIFLIIMIVFRSFSLPVVLVLVIQGAIWISMSTALLEKEPMFFMSYIIATCILMGATIDYGILMSSTYLDARATMDKKEALLKAVNTAIPTVFTSGVILTVCGFIVGWISSQRSIATVGVLLGKGALVSSLMITLVLPSILYFLDWFVLKLSIRKRVKAAVKVEATVEEADSE